MKRITATGFITLAAFTAVAVTAFVLYRGSLLPEKKDTDRQGPRVVYPQTAPESDPEMNGSERLAREDAFTVKVPLLEGEIIAAVLTLDLNGDLQDEQIIASRVPSGGGSAPIRITCLAFDPAAGGYRRVWSADTGATRPGTVSISTEDLIGDRGLCIIVAGMNQADEHTLDIFRRTPGASHTAAWPLIARIHIDGTIAIQETERSMAYRMGQATGQAYTIIAYSRDPSSGNILDRTEILYRYNERARSYVQERRTRVPGSQIEQRRVRELLSGRPAEFEQFISGLWYYISRQGTLDSRQYIYFDPANREIIFFVDETQQVFSWHASSVTRYGLYLSSQNVSVTTLRRSIDIELESLSGIRIRVIEDVRLPIGVTNSWDGSYRKAGSIDPDLAGPEEQAAPPSRLDAVYEGSIGRLSFSPEGTYTLSTDSGAARRGTYSFFSVRNTRLVEFSPGLRQGATAPNSPAQGGARDTWEAAWPDETTLRLTRISLTTRGIRELHETPLTLSRQ